MISSLAAASASESRALGIDREDRFDLGRRPRPQDVYRRAWLLVDELNQIFAKPVVSAHPGGAKGGGASLTDQGRRIVALYRDAEAKMRAAAQDEIDALERALGRRQSRNNEPPAASLAVPRPFDTAAV